MEKFFKNLYTILISKSFRFCFILFIIISLFCFHYRGNFNKDKFLNNVELIRQNTKQLEIEKKYNITNDVVKKQIVKDNQDANIVKKELTTEQKKDIKIIENRLKKIDNILLKLKELEKQYNEKLANNKINYNRIIKKGDTIYFSLKTIIKTGNKINTQPSSLMKLFTIVNEKDMMSKKLIGRKIGEKITFTYDEFLVGMGEEEREQVKQTITDNINNVVKKYGVNKQILQNYEITYEMEALDFISKNIIEELNLTKDN